LTEYYKGVIDSVAVWNKKLSSTEVAKLWNTGDKSGYHLTTKEYDPDAGLYYFWQRFYDPKNGRFTQRAEFPFDEEHPYGFCSNNPYNYVDLTGEGPPSECWWYGHWCVCGDSYACYAQTICKIAGDNPMANCIRNCLLDRYQPRQSPLKTIKDHIACYAECVLNKGLNARFEMIY
jgi:RHS repeat-associated protein